MFVSSCLHSNHLDIFLVPWWVTQKFWRANSQMQDHLESKSDAGCLDFSFQVVMTPTSYLPPAPKDSPHTVVSE